MLQAEEKGGNVVSPRARVVRAKHENAPVFYVLRFLQPKVYSEVLKTAPQSRGSAPAKMGKQGFETFCLTDGVMGVAKTSHFEFGASDTSASFLQDVAELVRLPSTRLAKAMCRQGDVSPNVSPALVHACRHGGVLLRLRSSRSVGTSAWV